jgi:hypothetical protein
MKKLLFTLFVLTTSATSFGQTILNSHSINLRGSKNNYQILNAINPQKQVFVFASDKEKVKVLKYNKFLFFADSLTINRPDKEYEFMAGYSFENNGNPCIYWASDDFKKIRSVAFDFENKINKLDNFQFSFAEESILNTFNENSSFYILTIQDKEDKLKIYSLRNGESDEKIIDFSSYKFIDEKGKAITFNDLIRQNGLEMIDTKALNPLFQTIGKSKMFVEENKIVLTFDSNSQTQFFQIDLTDFSVSQKMIPQQILAKSGKANSYFHQNKLYQLKINDEELAISAINLRSGETIKKYYADSKDTISFRNSPLFSQTGSQAGREMKNTKKFLQRLYNSEIGLSVYKTKEDIMVTVGGVRNVASTGNILIGLTAGAAMVATGSGGDMSSLFDSGSLQSTYFESLFDDKFEHQNVDQQGLAFDFISQFLNDGDATLQSIFPFEDYYILSYYDSKRKEIVMRKFEDISEFN